MSEDVFKNCKRLRYDIKGKNYGGKYMDRLKLSIEALSCYIYQYKEIGKILIKNREKNISFSITHENFKKMEYLHDLLSALKTQYEAGGKGDVTMRMSFDYSYEIAEKFYGRRKPDRNRPNAHVCYIYKYKGIYLKLIRLSNGLIQAISFHEA